jgi:hypothetical protein
MFNHKKQSHEKEKSVCFSAAVISDRRFFGDTAFWRKGLPVRSQ